ncbi:MAG TPA: nuclear transport factor 2 family protein [Spirochaetota bacterium]|nr:nuclear transport factor 2 family protein [Spirochaetota bacterium]
MIGAIIAKIQVRKGFDLFSRQELDKLLSAWRDDAYLVYPGDVPASGTHQGKDALRKWFKNFFENYPEFSFKVKNVCVDNIFDLTGTNTIAVYWEFDSTTRNGGKWHNTGFSMFNIRFGKIVSCRDFMFDAGPGFRKSWGVK